MPATKSRRKPVLKDFSQLSKLDQHRISIVSSEILHIAFKGKAIADFEPKAKTQVHRAWKSSKLSERQQIAWRYFLDDIMLAEGHSGKVAGSYGDFVDRGEGDGFRVPTAYINAHYKRLEVLRVYLSPHERTLLAELLQDTLRANSHVQLETIGLIRSGYSDKDSARVAGVVHIQNLLERLAAFYQV